MSFPADLLDQARFLARKEPRRPLQASLRRSISSAYYALFHFFCEESAKLIVGAGPADRALRDLARRAVAHGKLKAVCAEFDKPTPKTAILKGFWSHTAGSDPIGIVGDSDFAVICPALRNLQDLRHRADYDFSCAFTRQDAIDACDEADAAMQAWTRLKSTKPDALKLFAMAILLWPGLSGRS
jgi:hypothetical protein